VWSIPSVAVGKVETPQRGGVRDVGRVLVVASFLFFFRTVGVMAGSGGGAVGSTVRGVEFY